MTHLDDETRRAVRAAQLAWYARWLEGEEARAAFRALVLRGRERLLTARLADLVDEPALERMLDAYLSPALLDGTLAPAVAALVDAIARRASLREESPGALVGAEAERAVARTAGEPEVVSAALVDAIVKTKGVEEAASEQLFEALDGFSRRVNPFVAEWGLPLLVGTLPLLARGAVKGALATFQAEFERRLEPEIRRYLATFVRRSFDAAASEFAKRRSDPDMVRLRTELASAVMAVPLEHLVWSPDTPAGKRALDAVAACVRGLGRHDALRAELRLALRQALADERSLAEALERHGISVPADDALADALWPGVRSLLGDAVVVDALGCAIEESLAPLGG